MRACASAGITVFGVGLDVAGPQALQVEGRLEGQHLGSGDPVEARGEPFDALVLAHVVEVPEVARRDDRALGVGRGTTPASRPVDGRPALGVPQRRERGDHALPRVRQQRRHARVRVDRHRPQVEVEDDDALAAGRDPGLAAHVEAAALDERRVGLAQPGPEIEHARRGRRCPSPPGPRRGSGRGRAADRSPPATPRPPRPAAGTRPCCPWRPRAQTRPSRMSGSYGGVVHSSSGRGGLHVVVLDGGHGARPVADLADDERRRAVDLEHLDRRAEAPEPLGGPVGRGAEPGVVAALGRDREVLDELRGPALEARLDQSVEGGEVDRRVRRGGHARLRSRSRNGSSTTVALTRPRRPSTVHSTCTPRADPLEARGDRGERDRLLEDRAPAVRGGLADLPPGLREHGHVRAVGGGRDRRRQPLLVVQALDVVPVEHQADEPPLRDRRPPARP